MTTPPLDLPALRDDLRMSTGRTFPIYREELQALLDRLVNAESAWTNWQNVGLGMQARAEAAEKKVAKVRELHAASPCEPDCCLLDTCNECLNTHPCPTIAALDTHTPETETP